MKPIQTAMLKQQLPIGNSPYLFRPSISPSIHLAAHQVSLTAFQSSEAPIPEALAAFRLASILMGSQY